MASRSYKKLVAQHRRDYPHAVTVQNAREWRDKVLDRAHFAATGGLLVQWFEDGEKVYGFKTAEQAAAFKRWVETCGIDWTTDPRDGPATEFKDLPERLATYGPTPRSR